MDSGSNAPPQPNTNGGGISYAQEHDLSHVVEALEAVFDPRSSNDTRVQASAYLEQAKKLPDAPSYGYNLASNRAQSAQLRFFGLTMLEYPIKYNWEDYSTEQGIALQGYVIQLAKDISEEDPVYLRNKVAQLWTEVAKRSWGAVWMDMDQLLVELWETSLHHRAIVLYVLETLSEEVFNREDTTAGLRSNELGRACVEIFTPAAVLTEQLPNRDTNLAVRYGNEGWLKRLCDNLDWCLSNDYEKDERIRTSAVKILNALRAAMSWILAKAIAAAQVVEHVCKALAVPAVPLQQAAIEVLHAIYTRHHPLTEDEFRALVCPMFTPGRVTLLREVYNWTLADMNINNLDDQKYTLCKKLSELCADLGNYIEQNPKLVPEGSDLPGFFSMLFEILRNASLVVSIPILHAWTKLLRSRTVRESEVVMQMLGGLLETCCSRLVRYEAFPEESEDATIQFLNEDIDTIPEKHAFLGNYRRFCADIVEVLVRGTPVEALQHILGQATNMLDGLYSNHPPFQPRNFSKHSEPVLRVDAQVTVIDAALKGYLKWSSTQGSDPQQDEHNRNVLENLLEEWGRQIMQARFEDPEIAKRIIQLMATFATKALPNRPAFALSLLDYLLNLRLHDDPSLTPYSDAVKDLERASSLDMQKLAMTFPNDFMQVYDQLERKINDIAASSSLDERQRMSFQGFLFIIVHRTTRLDRSVQEQRMRHMLDGIKDAWGSESISNSLQSFDSFCDLIGMGRLPDFLSSHDFYGVQDWSAQSLDEEGRALQASIMERSTQLPLRMTKTLLAASIEKLRDGSQAYEMAAVLWSDAIPLILPNLLKLVSYAQAFNNMQNWQHLPQELQHVIRRALTDRFWQAGISTESRDDFFARVSGSKSTYEGFASTVRGTIRQIRESAYYILYSLTRFRHFFYGIADLAEPLSQALFNNAQSLSSHHLSVLLSVATQLVDACPADLRRQFLPTFTSSLFRELDRKITREWDAITHQVTESRDNDNLTDEMKTESILRQLTYSSVSLVSALVDPNRGPESAKDENSMWKFVLSTPDILIPVLMFCKNVIQVRDTRCVVLSVRVLRTLLPRFTEKSDIRDFYCVDILQAAITSLHEPYFVDCQKDLASLIANIINLDIEITRSILLSLPGMQDAAKVDRRLLKLQNGSGKDPDRTQRSIVLDILSNVRGVSIHEQGKIKRALPKKKSAIQEQYMSVDAQPTIVRGTSPGLAGVADMFGDA